MSSADPMRGCALTTTLVTALLAATATAQVSNGGFETGDLSGWSRIGRVFAAGDVGSAPTEGDFQAVASSSPTGALVGPLEVFLYGSATGALLGLGNGTPSAGAALKQTFTAAAGDTLAFHWNFLSSEAAFSFRNDFAFVVLDGDTAELADMSAGFRPSPTAFFQETGFQVFQTPVAAGTHTLALGVADVNGDFVGSGLLIDDVAICSGDADGDGIVDCADPCIGPGAFDADGDTVCDLADNCPRTPNPGQEDADGDGFGDACPPIYSIDRNSPTLRIIATTDASTLVAIPLLASASIFGGHGLALDPVSGLLYATLDASGFSGRVLATIDPTTGQTTLIGDTGRRIADLSFDCDGVLYGSTGQSGTDARSLFEIDPLTGTATLLGPMPNSGSGQVIAFNPADELLYHGTFGALQAVDPFTLTATPIPLSGDPFSEPSGLTLTNHQPDTFFVAFFSSLATVTTSGVVTHIGGMEVSSRGLAARSAAGLCQSGPRCLRRPQHGCTEAGRAKVLVDERRSGREKLVVKMTKLIPQTLAGDFGDPVGGDAGYAVCLYDGDDELAGELTVDRSGDTCGSGPCWRAIRNGYRFKDPDGTSGGLQRVVLRAGAPGTGKAIAVARNRGGAAHLPTGIAAALGGSLRATVQVRGTNRRCIGTELPIVRQADAFLFKGVLP